MDLFTGMDIQVPRGLVGQDHQRLVHERPCDRDSLLLAPGKFAGLVAQAVAEPHLTEQLGRSLLRGRGTASLNQRRHHDILQRGQVKEEMMELEHESYPPVPDVGGLLVAEGAEVAAVQTHSSRGRSVESTQKMKERGLSGTACPHDRYRLALIQGEVQPSEDVQIGPRDSRIGTAEAASLEDWRAITHLSHA